MGPGARISVVIPCYDGLPDVLDAVESVLAQTRPADEVLVVDDESRDGSAAALLQRFGDRIRVIAGSYGNAGATRNAGWRAATGEWIAFLDADDLWAPDKLAVAMERLAAAPRVDWFFSDGAFRSADGQWHASWFGLYADVVEPYVGAPLAQLFEVNFVLTSSTVVRRTALEATGGFDERLSHAEDLDMWIRLSRRGLATASRRALIRYQHRQGGLSSQTALRLEGGRQVFAQLAGDTTLTPALRRRARRRAALYAYKLGVQALREGRLAEARSLFARAWLFPSRAIPVTLAYVATLLPTRFLEWLRDRRTAVALAAPMVAVRHVTLHGEDPAGVREVPASDQAKGRS